MKTLEDLYNGVVAAATIVGVAGGIVYVVKNYDEIKDDVVELFSFDDDKEIEL